MTGTMTSAGLDVDARSIDAVAICVATGELTRRRFGSQPGPVIGWLKALPGPVRRFRLVIPLSCMSRCRRV
jgi:hypothetical protein